MLLHPFNLSFSTHQFQCSLQKDQTDLYHCYSSEHFCLRAFSFLYSRCLVVFCTEVITIRTVLSSRADSDLSFCSRNLHFFHTLSTSSPSGPVLLRTVPKMKAIHAKRILNSIQMGFFQIPHCSLYEYDSQDYLHK